MPADKTGKQPEPWLRGTRTELPAVVRAVIHAFDLSREDVLAACAGLSETDLHSSPSGLTPIAYHLRHIPRSLDRLLTYAEGHPLRTEQLAALKTESDPGVTRDALILEFEEGMETAMVRVQSFAGSRARSARSSFPRRWAACLSTSPTTPSATPARL